MTGRSEPAVCGESAADRLWRSLDYRLSPTTPGLTRNQVAIVLHALADHTAITEALRYRRDESSPWPEANSLGRWFHDTADQMEHRAIQILADYKEIQK
jgi:hypothetical protein